MAPAPVPPAAPWHAPVTRVAGIAFDRVRGAGATPFDEEVGERGAVVLMRPSAFLALAAPLHAPREGSVRGLRDLLEAGGALCPASLSVGWPDRPARRPRVNGHEGRHRMGILKSLTGDAPLPVHLFVPGLRSRFLTAERLDAMRAAIVDETGRGLLHGPLFGDALCCGETRAGPEGHGVSGREPYAEVALGAGAEACLARLHAEGARTFREARVALAATSQEEIDGWDGWFAEHEAFRSALLAEIARAGLRLGEDAEVAGHLPPDLVEAARGGPSY